VVDYVGCYTHRVAISNQPFEEGAFGQCRQTWSAVGEVVEVTRLLTNTAPCNVIRRFSLGEIRQFRWFLAFVK
jgi:hypothetical protein